MEKVATAVLSTANKVRQRAKRSEKGKTAKEVANKGDSMQIDEAPSVRVTPAPSWVIRWTEEGLQSKRMKVPHSKRRQL